jgi:hypothetical protein
MVAQAVVAQEKIRQQVMLAIQGQQTPVVAVAVAVTSAVFTAKAETAALVLLPFVLLTHQVFRFPLRQSFQMLVRQLQVQPQQTQVALPLILSHRHCLMVYKLILQLVRFQEHQLLSLAKLITQSLQQIHQVRIQKLSQ